MSSRKKIQGKVRGVLKGIRYDDSIVRFRGEKIISSLRKILGKDPSISYGLAIDAFYTMYLPYPIIISPSEVDSDLKMHYALVKSIIYSKELEKHKSLTIADSCTSMIMAISYLENLLLMLEQLMENQRSSSEQQLRNELMKGMQDKGGNLSQRPEVQKLIEELSHEALKRAIEDAKTAKKIKHLASGLMAGTGSEFSFEDRVHEVLKLARSLDVRIILDIIGNIPKHSIRARRRVVRHPKGELTGYEIGGDIERIVPTEIAAPDPLFKLKLAENKLLLYEKVLPEKWGPIYVVLDKSGSMEGEKILWAKAVSLALYIRALKECRPFYLRFFDSLPYPLIKVTKRPRSSEALKLIEYLAKVKGGGGTDITRAILTACNDVLRETSRSISDIILITDGEDRIAEVSVKRAISAANARLITVMIQGDNADLRRLSYKYFTAIKLDEEEILKIIELG